MLDELRELLKNLGVELENERGESGETSTTAGSREANGAVLPLSPPPTPGDQDELESVLSTAATTEMTLFEVSKTNYGVFYRLDLVNHIPQLRIYLPVEEGPQKLECYLVVPRAHTPPREWFTGLTTYLSSNESNQHRTTLIQNLLHSAGELLKALFWEGDLEEMWFPGEIIVRLVSSSE